MGPVQICSQYMYRIGPARQFVLTGKQLFTRWNILETFEIVSVNRPVVYSSMEITRNVSLVSTLSKLDLKTRCHGIGPQKLVCWLDFFSTIGCCFLLGWALLISSTGECLLFLFWVCTLRTLMFELNSVRKRLERPTLQLG